MKEVVLKFKTDQDAKDVFEKLKKRTAFELEYPNESKRVPLVAHEKSSLTIIFGESKKTPNRLRL